MENVVNKRELRLLRQRIAQDKYRKSHKELVLQRRKEYEKNNHKAILIRRKKLRDKTKHLRLRVGKYIRTPEIRELHRKAFNPNVTTFKGRHHTEENKEKQRQDHLGTKLSEETKRKIGLKSLGNHYALGSKRSEEVKRKMSKDRKGRIPHNKGKKGIFHHTLEHRQKMSKLMSGEKCHFWKGGITPVSRMIRESMEYRLWREAVFKKDNHTCVWCGLKGGNGKRVVLNADHYLITFSVILNKLIMEQGLEDLLEKAMKYEMFWIVDNGRTLCEPCHRKTDTWGVSLKYI